MHCFASSARWAHVFYKFIWHPKLKCVLVCVLLTLVFLARGSEPALACSTKPRNVQVKVLSGRLTFTLTPSRLAPTPTPPQMNIVFIIVCFCLLLLF